MTPIAGSHSNVTHTYLCLVRHAHARGYRYVAKEIGKKTTRMVPFTPVVSINKLVFVFFVGGGKIGRDFDSPR